MCVLTWIYVYVYIRVIVIYLLRYHAMRVSIIYLTNHVATHYVVHAQVVYVRNTWRASTV